MRTIAHISDIHFGKIDPVVVEGLVADLNQSPPSLLVVSGDLTQRARAGQYRSAAALLARLPQPQLVVPGNHDVPLYDVFHRFCSPLKNYRKYITPNLQPIYHDQEMFVLGLNTARSFTFTLNGFWKDGRISEQQLQEIHTATAGIPESVFKVVVTHHPFIPPPGRRRYHIVHGAARALDMMEQCGIDLLLAGHLHLGYSGDVRMHHKGVMRSILSVQAGSATSTRRRGEPNAYNWIIVEPDRVTIEVRTWDGSRFCAQTASRFIRADGVWNRLT